MMHYYFKWRGKDESLNSWVAQTELEGTYMLELMAEFEEGSAEEEGNCERGGCRGGVYDRSVA